MSLTGNISGGRRALLSSRSGILKGSRLLASLAVTMLGLLLITFLIGMVSEQITTLMFARRNRD